MAAAAEREKGKKKKKEKKKGTKCRINDMEDTIDQNIIILFVKDIYMSKKN